eukprot:1146984-Pelagomonas_calceolata.AAC.7
MTNVSPGDPSQAAQCLKCKAETLAAAGNAWLLSAGVKELSELDLGDWNPSMAEAAAFLKKRDCSAGPTQLQIIEATKPDYLHDFWLSKANQQFPLLAVACKLLSAHNKRCSRAELVSMGAHIHHLAQLLEH